MKNEVVLLSDEIRLCGKKKGTETNVLVPFLSMEIITNLLHPPEDF